MKVPGAILYESRVTPLNPDQKENFWNQIDEWLEQGVIEPSVSPWASPASTSKEEGLTDKVGHKSKRA